MMTLGRAWWWCVAAAAVMLLMTAAAAPTQPPAAAGDASAHASAHALTASAGDKNPAPPSSSSSQPRPRPPPAAAVAIKREPAHIIAATSSAGPSHDDDGGGRDSTAMMPQVKDEELLDGEGSYDCVVCFESCRKPGDAAEVVGCATCRVTNRIHRTCVGKGGKCPTCGGAIMARDASHPAFAFNPSGAAAVSTFNPGDAPVIEVPPDGDGRRHVVGPEPLLGSEAGGGDAAEAAAGGASSGASILCKRGHDAMAGNDDDGSRDGGGGGGDGGAVNQDEAQAEEERRQRAEASALLAKAAGGDVYAMYRAGDMWSHGKLGMMRDDARAAMWYERAAARGHASAMTDLGACYMAGQGVPQSSIMAVYQLTRAATLGSEHGCFIMASLFSTGQGGMPRSEDEVTQWLTKMRGGRCSVKDSSEASRKEADKWLRDHP